MRNKTRSIRTIMILNITLLILLFLIIIVSDRIIQEHQQKTTLQLIQNNQSIDKLNGTIERYKLDFNAFLASGNYEYYQAILNDSKTITNLLTALRFVFNQNDELILFSRIVAQINETVQELVTEYTAGNKNTPDVFDLVKQIQTAFTVLTDAWNTLINYYLQSSHVSWTEALDSANQQKQMQTILIILASFSILLFVGIFTNDLLKRLRNITKAADALSMQKWETENLSSSRYVEFMKVSTAFNKMKAQILSDLRKLQNSLRTEQQLFEQKLENKKQQLLMQQTKYDLLQAQINPHFLFNTLNMIIRTIQSNENKMAISLIRATSELLRNSIELESRPIPLTQELGLLHDYLTIIRERNKGRITFRMLQFAGNLQVLIPSFSLQGLVENAVKHGLSEKSNDGIINIDVFDDEEGGTFISITDNGKGAPQDFFDSLQTNTTGHGLLNCIDRLSLLYTNNDVIRIKSTPGEGCSVILHLNEEYLNVEIINR